ncbi:YIPF6-like protein [Globisporangium polare]
MADVEAQQQQHAAPSEPAPFVSGSISLPSAEENTLDEPVSATILRDVRLVAGKLKVVLMPRNTSEETLKALRDWDLWGPLMLCLSLSIMLSMTAPAHQSAMVFTGVFVVVWAGAAIVTINAQLLGSTISFFQSVCVLGYCVFPLNIATLLCMVLSVVVSHVALRMLIVGVGFIWSTKASVVFMSKLVPPKRKALTVYPVLLFYLFISWMVLIQ